MFGFFTSVHDKEIEKLIDENWNDFEVAAKTKIGHIERKYLFWKYMGVPASIVLVAAIVFFPESHEDPVLELVSTTLDSSLTNFELHMLLLMTTIVIGLASLFPLVKWYQAHRDYVAALNPLVYEKAFQIIGIEAKHIARESYGMYGVLHLVKQSELVTVKANTPEVDDRVQFEFEGRTVDFSELSLRHIVGSGRYRHERKVFHGFFVAHKLPKKLTGKTFITTERDRRGFAGRKWFFQKNDVPKETLLEWNDFENKLHVATTDETEARYVLTPDFMAVLYDWWVSRKGKIRVSFISDYLYVLYPDKKIKIGTGAASLKKSRLKSYMFTTTRPLWHMHEVLQQANVRLRMMR